MILMIFIYEFQAVALFATLQTLLWIGVWKQNQKQPNVTRSKPHSHIPQGRFFG
ncbi:hypothetical protein OF83DRAFT_1178629 [Amylostereum chailletii]|nr:hypothetical protein OF83DRAFT_1178629 [Amylostereum chailletii]